MVNDWNGAVDRLLAGFAHNANGRTVSLEGLLVLIESGAEPELWLPLLRDEAARLARHSGGLHAVAPDMGDEPLDPRDLVALAARALDAVHVVLQPPEVNASEDVAVHASRTAYVRALVLTVLAALPPGTESTVHSRLERRGRQVVLRLAPERAWRVVSLDAAEALLAPYSGRLTMSSEELEVQLPALH